MSRCGLCTIFLLSIFFTQLSVSEAKRCQAYFMEPYDLHKILAVTVAEHAQKSGEFEISNLQIEKVRKSKNLEEADKLVLGILRENREHRISFVSLVTLYKIMLEIAQIELMKRDIDFRFESEVTDYTHYQGHRRSIKVEYIEILPSKRSVLNRFASDIGTKYHKKIIISPFLVYLREFLAMVREEDVIVPIRAIYNFRPRDSYIFHELIHVRVDGLSNSSIYMDMLFESEGQRLPLWKNGYHDSFRYDEIFAFEREAQVLIQNILTRIKQGKSYSDELNRFLKVGHYYLDLSNFTYRILTEIVSSEITQKTFIPRLHGMSLQVSVYNKYLSAEVHTNMLYGRISRQGILKNQVIDMVANQMLTAQKEAEMRFFLARLVSAYLAEIIQEGIFEKPQQVYFKLKQLQAEYKLYKKQLRTQNNLQMNKRYDFGEERIEAESFR